MLNRSAMRKPKAVTVTVKVQMATPKTPTVMMLAPKKASACKKKKAEKRVKEKMSYYLQRDLVYFFLNLNFTQRGDSERILKVQFL